MIIRPFLPYHIDLLRAQGVQGAQLNEVSIVPGGYAIVPPGIALSAFEEERILICGGIIPLAPSHGVCWALLSMRAGKHMQALHYAVRRLITLEPWRRLEATVEEGFPMGCRWLELLGFVCEGAMPKYGLNGEMHLRYGRT